MPEHLPNSQQYPTPIPNVENRAAAPTDIWSRTRRFGAAALAGVLLIPAADSVQKGQPANADASYEYTIENTGGEGVWLHEQPGLHNRHDGIRIMMDGTKFKADCYVLDTPIGDRDNPVWLYGIDETGHRGYFTDFYSSSHWSSEDKSGLPPMCGSEAQTGSTAEPTSTPEQTEPSKPVYHAVFYAPGDGDTVWYDNKNVKMPVPDDVYAMATQGDKHPKWTDSSEQCGTANADNFESKAGSGVTTLGGWSIGRLGPTYYLEHSSAKQRDAINYIILIDPGSRHEYEDNDCDKKYNQSDLYAEWLNEDSDNRLTILAGNVTEDAHHQTHANGRDYAHAGIQNGLFGEIRGTKLANQVTVCNYSGMEHVPMYEHFRNLLSSPAIKSPSNCPRNPVNGRTEGWRP